LLHSNCRTNNALLQISDLTSRCCLPSAVQPMMISSLACSTTAPRNHTRGLGSSAAQRRLPLVPANQTAISTFFTKKTSRLSIDVRLDGYGISSPANDLPVPVSILACCGYTATLWYLHVSTTVPTRSHVSPSLLGVPILPPCQVSLRSGKGFISRLYAHLAKQVSHSRSSLLPSFI
jgi:hypothetical protein